MQLFEGSFNDDEDVKKSGGVISAIICIWQDQ
jgi:hypothetical protein